MSAESQERDGRVVSFLCSMCGGCCNSAPQLSLPELFHHQTRFIGCLAIRRLPREAEVQSLAERLLFRVEGAEGPDYVLLAAQAFDDPARGSCPALAEDKRCSIELDRKPKNCRSVPLEALLPDHQQRAVLARRAREAAFFGADCIVVGRRPGHLPLLDDVTLASDAESALEARRQELSDDKRFWGRAVFELLRPELFDHQERVAKLPVDGFFLMSLAPALALIASASARCRKRCIGFLNAQIELTAEVLGRSAKPSPQSIGELSGLLRASVALRSSFQLVRDRPAPSPEAPALEAWLGLGDEGVSA